MKLIWRTHTTVILIAGVVALVVATALAFMVTQFEARTNVWIGATLFEMRVADNEPERQRGLLGVKSLGPNEGLLMAYPSEGLHKISMRRMNMPIDIMWLNKEKEIVYTVVNASADSLNGATFTPNDPAQYVIELPAGSAKKFNIKVGDVAEFTESEDVH